MLSEPSGSILVTTENLRHDLDRALVTGVAWAGAAKWTSQALTWLVTLIVARLLTPADYGIIGYSALYFGVVGAMAEFGIGSAVVAMRNLSPDQIRQLNGLALLLGIVTCAFSAALSVPLALFFEEPRLASVVLVTSCGAILSSIRIVPEALLRKELKFAKVAGCEAAQAVTGALASLALAIAGKGYWALVLGNLTGVAIQTALILASRRPGVSRPRPSGIGAAVSFSRDVLASRLLWYVYDNADFLVAGKMLGTAQLGAYRLAWTFASMPLDKIVSLVGHVTPAVLAAVQDKPSELRRYVLRISEAVSFAVFPIGVGLALVADDFVRVVLGQAWVAAAAPLRILAVYASVRAVSPIWSQVLLVTGDTRFLMRVSALGALVLPVAFLWASRWGLSGIALAWVVCHPVAVVFPILRRMLARIDLPAASYWRSVSGAVGACLAMTASVLALQHQLSDSPAVLRLASTVTVGMTTYALFLLVVAPDQLRSMRRAFYTARGARVRG